MGTLVSFFIVMGLLVYVFYTVRKIYKSSKTNGCTGCCSGCKSSCKSLYTQTEDEHKNK